MFLLIGERWFSGAIQAACYNAGLVLWVISELCIFILSGQSDKKDHNAAKHDRMSISGIMAANIISCLIALFGTQHLQIAIPAATAWAGIVIFFFGVILRAYSVWILKKYFTVSVEIKTDHNIIRRGPYRYLRHPSYSGSVLSLFGMQMGIRNPVGLIVTLIIAVFAYSYRIRVEEAVMEENFGAEYEDYKKKTKRLIPFVF